MCSSFRFTSPVHRGSQSVVRVVDIRSSFVYVLARRFGLSLDWKFCCRSPALGIGTTNRKLSLSDTIPKMSESEDVEMAVSNEQQTSLAGKKAVGPPGTAGLASRVPW